MCRNGGGGRETVNLRAAPHPTERLGLEADKAANCEQFHQGAWETQAQRGGCDPSGTSRAGLAYFSTLDGQTPGVSHKRALFLEIYEIYQIWQLANL